MNYLEELHEVTDTPIYMDVYSNLAAKYFNLTYMECQELKDDKPYLNGKLKRNTIKMALDSHILTPEAPQHTYKWLEWGEDKEISLDYIWNWLIIKYPKLMDMISKKYN